MLDYKCINSIEYASQDEERIIIQFYRLDKHKNVIYWICSIFSIGVLWVFQRWFIGLKLKLRYQQCQQEECTNVLVIKYKHSIQLGDAELIDLTDSGVFTYECIRYKLSDQQFEPISNQFELSNNGQIITSKPLSTEQANQNLHTYGPNVMDIIVQPYHVLLVDQILTPFNLFQVFAIILWAIDDYLFYALLILVLTVIQIVTSLRELRKQLMKIKRIIAYTADVTVIRDDQQIIINSDQLVPGDIIQITQDKIPCDCILIQGYCTVNEAILTGESLPVNKVALKEYSRFKDEMSYLYSGTNCIKTSPNTQALVYRTGFSTLKGDLARSMLFSRNESHQFERDTYKYLLVMGCVGLLFACLTIYSGQFIESDTKTQVWRAVEVMTIVIPPTLPAALAAGIVLAIHRLKHQHIRCIRPKSINVVAKVNVIAFDKTGTLTELGLDVMNGQQNDGMLLECFVSCHSLVIDDEGLKGDPIDLGMFNSTGWEYSDINGLGRMNNGEQRIDILRRFEFNATLQRMSVIIQVNNQLRFYCKGSPEQIQKLCVQSTIPNNYNEQIDEHTKKGLRVIACAYRDVLDTNQQQEHYENDLIYLGLLIFENKLKQESQDVIKQLQDANLRTIMVTGDIAQTAVYVAQQCGILNEQYSFVEIINDELIIPEQQLIVTGSVFEYILANNNHDKLGYILEHTRVYARMKPSMKGDLMVLLQQQNNQVLFCGDGANDTCALKLADVGLALSVEEASLAAPFSSSIHNITGVLPLLLEGRTSFVTAIECFKFMTLYSVIQSVAVLQCYFQDSDFTMWQYLYQDLCLIIPFAFTMNLTKAHTQLANYLPCCDLMSIPVIQAVLIIVLICVVTQIISYLILINQEFYQIPIIKESKKESDNVNTLFTIISNAQVIGIALAFTQGPPFRQYFYKNRWFMMWLIVAIITHMLFILYTESITILDIGQVYPWYFKVYLVEMSVIIIVCIVVYEKVVTEKLRH